MKLTKSQSEPYSGTVEKAPTRNPNFYFGTYLLSDLDNLFEAGVPRGATILIGAILLNFLRNQFVANKRRAWHAPQKWYLHNQFSEKIFSRQFIGECLDWLVTVGVVSKKKEPGYTNQICYSFMGFSSNGQKKETLAIAKRKLTNVVESQIQNNVVESQIQNNVLLEDAHPHPDADLLHPEADLLHPSYIDKNNTSPSQNLTGGENCVTFENRENDREGISQQSTVIENGNKYPRSIKDEKGEFPRRQKIVGSDKSSERAISPVSSAAVNSITPAQKGQLYRRPGSMLSEDELTQGHYLRYKDYEFMAHVARDWSSAGGEQSYTGALKTLAQKIGVVEKSFLKNPPKIDVEWKAFINGAVVGCIENLVDSMEKGLNQKHYFEEQLNRYLPSIAIEVQSDRPVASKPMLEMMGQLIDQYQLAEQQHQPQREQPSIAVLQNLSKHIGEEWVEEAINNNPQWGCSKATSG